MVGKFRFVPCTCILTDYVAVCLPCNFRSSWTTSTFIFDAARYSGRTGVHFEFKGKRKQHLERVPVLTTIFHLDYNNILENSTDPDYYDSGELATGYA